MIEQFKKDVKVGLSASPKYLSSKYFYDKKGSELFQEIMNMPEYYLTNCERELIENKKEGIVSAFNVNKNETFELIELGAGDGTKTIELLHYLVSNNYKFIYVPIDISLSALQGLELFLKKELPALNVRPKQGDYFTVLNDLKASNHLKIVMFIGSNLGNLTDEQAKLFIQQVSKKLNKKDKLLLGLDLMKPREVVLPAYNDKKGITRAFNLNLLTRINHELNANFVLDQFSHYPTYSETEGIAKSYLVSNQKQAVRIQAIDTTFHFEKDEKIHTEISRKYSDAVLDRVVSESKFKLLEKFTDSKAYFADYVLENQ